MCVVGVLSAVHDAGHLPELAAYLVHHLARCATHSLHRDSGEDEGEHRTDKHADNHLGVDEHHLVALHHLHQAERLKLFLSVSGKSGPIGEAVLAAALKHMRDTDLHFLKVGSKQRDAGQCGRANRESLARCGRCVAKRVESVGPFPHFGRQARHFSVAARVVRNRPVRVRGQGDAERGQHANGGDADAVQAHAHRRRRE